MKIIIMLLSCCLTTVASAARQNGATTNDGIIPTYELYSWKDADGSWTFSLLYTTNRQKTVEEVFNPKTALHGLKQLKEKVSKLEKGARIVWFDRLTLGGVKIKDSERLQYPPKQIMNDVKQYAATRRNIQVVQ